MSETTRFTVIPVLYRDAGNYKAHGCIVIRGGCSSEDLQSIRAALVDGLWFDPGEPGWRHLAEDWPRFPGPDDHPLHEMLLDEAAEGHPPFDALTITSAAGLVDALRRAR